MSAPSLLSCTAGWRYRFFFFWFDFCFNLAFFFLSLPKLLISQQLYKEGIGAETLMESLPLSGRGRMLRVGARPVGGTAFNPNFAREPEAKGQKRTRSRRMVSGLEWAALCWQSGLREGLQNIDVGKGVCIGEGLPRVPNC